MTRTSITAGVLLALLAVPFAGTARAQEGPSKTEQRAIAKKAAHFEEVHRTRQARIDRLIRIYRAKGETAKVARLEELRKKDDQRTANAMEGFRRRLGDENWGRVNSQLKRHHGRDEHQKDKDRAKGRDDEENAREKAKEKEREKEKDKRKGKGQEKPPQKP